MKKTIKWVSALLALIVMLSACGTPKETESETQAETEKETDAVVTDKYAEKTVSMKDAADSYKAMGRTYVSGESLICDHAASGAEFALDCRGDVMVRVTAKNSDTVFTVVVDDVATKNIAFSKGSGDYKIAEGLSEGFHIIRLVNEGGYTKPCAIDSVTFSGSMIKMAENDFYIEFVGDSISAGYGLGATAGEVHDATLAYPYLTAEKLGADYTICARSGLGVAYSAGASNIFENYYPYQSVERGTAAYAPTRTPDLVVINLHTNDNYQWYSKGGNVEGDYYNFATFDAKLDNIVKTVAKTHGKDVPMLFVFGCMANDKYTLATDRSIELIETKYVPEGYHIKTVTLPTSRDGKEAHPSASGAKKQAEALAEFIKENYYN